MQAFFCFTILLFIPAALRLLRIPRWSPAYIFCVLWWFQFTSCYLFLPNREWSTVTAAYLLLCCLSLLVGFCWANKKITNFKKGLEFDEVAASINYEGAKSAIKIFILIGIAFSVIMLVRHGFSWASFMSVDALLDMNHQFAVTRYKEGNADTADLLSRIILAVVYAAPLAGGTYFPYTKNYSEKILCFLTFLPAFLVLFSQNTKATFIAAIIFWVSACIVSIIILYGKIKLSVKNLVKSIFLFTITGILLFVSMVLRIGTFNAATIDTVKQKFIRYALSHILAIDSWIDANLYNSDFSLGGQTFIGFAQYLGYTSRQQGVYSDVFYGDGFSTNVFTYFRGIYQDFSFVGSMVFFLVLGIIMGYAYRKVCNLTMIKNSTIVLLVLTYSFSLFYFVSLFSYGSFIVAFLFYYIFLDIIHPEGRLLHIPRFKFVLRRHSHL